MSGRIHMFISQSLDLGETTGAAVLKKKKEKAVCMNSMGGLPMGSFLGLSYVYGLVPHARTSCLLLSPQANAPYFQSKILPSE